MKKIIACIMALVLLVSLYGCCLNIPGTSQKPATNNQKPATNNQKPATNNQKPSTGVPDETAPVEQEEIPEGDQAVIDALNGLVVGLTTETGNVSAWSDEDVCGFIYCTLMWDGFGSNISYLDKMGLTSSVGTSGADCYDLEKVEALTQGALGRSIPTKKVLNYAYAENGEFLILPAAGASTFNRIQNYTVRGDEIVAVGTSMFCGGYNEISGYFEIVAKVNPASVYGYTLVSVKDISGNQDFSNLTATASSVLENSKSYAAANAIDGNEKTAWVEGAYGDGIGQWLKISTADGSQMEISALAFKLGYHKSNTTFIENGRPTVILLQFEDGTEQRVEYLSDSDAILLDKPAKTSWVKITILEATTGTVYTDTCISEVILYGLAT